MRTPCSTPSRPKPSARLPTELEKAENFEAALHALIRREMTAHQRIIFNGNGYTDEWVAEATRRGLPNLRSMVDAVPGW